VINGWTKVNLSTNIIEIASKNKYAARECLEIYILWKNIPKEEMYYPRVIGKFIIQKTLKYRSWLGWKVSLWCEWSPNTNFPSLYTRMYIKNAPIANKENLLWAKICFLFVKKILTIVRRCESKDLGAWISFLFSQSTW